MQEKMEVVKVCKVYKTCSDVVMFVNLPGILKDFLLQTNCKTKPKDSHLRLGLQRSLFPSGLPTKALHAPLVISRTRMGSIYWIDLAQERDMWRDLVNALIMLSVP